MRRLLWLVPAILFACLPASAQETPWWELSGGYSHFFADVSHNSFDLNGGTGAIQENINDWFGGRIQISAYSGDTGGAHITSQTYSGGPVFSYRKFQRFTPFAQVQFGAIHASAGYVGISESSTKFMVAPGGGVDVGLNPRFAVRFQGSYVTTNFVNDRQNNFQFSAELVVRLGHKP